MTGGETEQLLRLQTEVLEAVAQGEALPAIGRLLCQRAEELAPEAVCSILLVDEYGSVRALAAPGLPKFYSAAINGLKIGPQAGSCGTAAYRREEVVVTDIASDPLWDDFRAMIAPLGLKACWSTPIKILPGR